MGNSNKSNRTITQFFKPVPKSTPSLASSQSSQADQQPPVPSIPTPSAQAQTRVPGSTTATSQAPQANTAERRLSGSSATPKATAQNPVAPLPEQTPSSPVLISSPIIGRSQRPPRPRDDIIEASDDDGDVSSDDLPDLNSWRQQRGSKPLFTRTETQPCVTPKAKRQAVAFLGSPLTLNQKRTKWNFEKLAESNRISAAAEASAKELDEMADWDCDKSESEPTGSTDQITTDALMKNTLAAIPAGEGSDEDGTRDRLLRAVRRTEARELEKEYYFFPRTSRALCITAVPLFPTGATTRLWKFLENKKTRDAVFEGGLVYSCQSKHGNLPDDIVSWVLHKVPLEAAPRLRDEYVILLGQCPDQTSRVVDESCINALFEGLGAPTEATNLDEKVVKIFDEDRSRTGCDTNQLRSVLQLLRETSHSLKFRPLVRATVLLVRLGLDNVVRDDVAVRKDYDDAMACLVASVLEKEWDNFCGEICTSVSRSVEDVLLRRDILFMIPGTHKCLNELRRRLAMVFLFDDLPRGRSHPEASFSLRAVITKMEDDMFMVSRQTDYHELLAVTSILAIAIDNGGGPSESSRNIEAVKVFNSEVDELASIVHRMWSTIPNPGSEHLSRFLARDALKELELVLLYMVRTRPPPREDPFDIKTDEYEDMKPKQQEFMRKFFKKKTV